MQTLIKEGKYIYCIIKAGQPLNFSETGIGERGDKLHSICFDGITAIVSDSPVKEYPVARENLLSHERAIEEVMKTYTVLPVRFSTIAEDEENVKKILEKNYDNFSGLLKYMEGKLELGLKAVFKEGIYNNILDIYKDIKALKDKFEAISLEKTYYQRMEIGRMVEAALQKEKEIHKKDILNSLFPLATETKLNNNYGEMMIVNAAFLVEDHREAEFDLTVRELDAKYSDKIKFKYVGTLPPFNFVNLVINTKEYQNVSA